MTRTTTLVLLIITCTSIATTAHADSWCARTIEVQEWGVHVFGRDGRPAPGPALPSWFITPEARGRVTRPAVRTLPADTGVRKLPVVHVFGGPGVNDQTLIPLGLEVGFAAGTASVWFPDVDRLAQTTDTRELIWDRLDLTPRPAREPLPTDVPWVNASRALDGALWVNGPGASERFVFYDGDTREATPLVLRRGPAWTPARRHYLITNQGRHPVHDIFLVHHERGARFVVYVPTLAARASVDVVLDDHHIAADAWAHATHDRLVASLALPAAMPRPPTAGDPCAMGRDPAVPFVRAIDHRLNPAVAELVAATWSDTFFASPGTRLVHREDVAYLEEAMPLAAYTDMFNTIVLRRAGLALQEDVVLP